MWMATMNAPQTSTPTVTVTHLMSPEIKIIYKQVEVEKLLVSVII